MKADRLPNPADGNSENTAESIAEAAAQPPCLRGLRRRDTERRGEFLITIKMDVVDAHFAGLNTIHDLLKVRVFDLQSITDQ